MTPGGKSRTGGWWKPLLIVNMIFVTLASLPLLLAYPTVFAQLGIASLENGFWVRLAGGWLFIEVVASYLAWRRPRLDADLAYVIIAMKAIFIVLVVLAGLSGSLPSSSLWIGAVIDLALSVALFVAIREFAGSGNG